MYIRAGRYCTMAEYAESMGLSIQSIRKAIRDKRLAGCFKIGIHTFVPEKAVLEYRNVKHGGYIGMAAMRKKPDKKPDTGAKLRSYRESKRRYYGKGDYEEFDS